LVDLDANPFKRYKELRSKWAVGDHYANPGGLQYSGHIAEMLNMTVELEHPLEESSEEEEEEEEEEDEKDEKDDKKKK